MTITSFTLALIVAGVLVLLYRLLTRRQVKEKAQEVLWDQNAGFVEALVQGYNLILSRSTSDGFELDGSIIDRSGPTPSFDVQRIPDFNEHCFYYYDLQDPEGMLIVFRASSGNLLYINRTRVAPNAFTFRSSYELPKDYETNLPFSFYPTAVPTVVGMVHEIDLLIKRLQLGAFEMPRRKGGVL